MTRFGASIFCRWLRRSQVRAYTIKHRGMPHLQRAAKGKGERDYVFQSFPPGIYTVDVCAFHPYRQHSFYDYSLAREVAPLQRSHNKGNPHHGANLWHNQHFLPWTTYYAGTT